MRSLLLLVACRRTAFNLGTKCSATNQTYFPSLHTKWLRLWLAYLACDGEFWLGRLTGSQRGILWNILWHQDIEESNTSVEKPIPTPQSATVEEEQILDYQYGCYNQRNKERLWLPKSKSNPLQLPITKERESKFLATQAALRRAMGPIQACRIGQYRWKEVLLCPYPLKRHTLDTLYE